MTAIVSNAYASQYANTHIASERKATYAQQNTAQKNVHSSATKVTLSEAAKAVLAKESEENSDAVATRARENLTKLLNSVKRTSPLKDDELAIDLSGFKRSELHAVAKNVGNKFTVDEQKAAALELTRRFDAALQGAHSVMRVTGSYKDLYETTLEYLNAAGADEKGSAEWQAQYKAVRGALERLEVKADQKPADIKDDPVADYLKRVSEGRVGKIRDIKDVAADARTVLDKMHSEAKGLDDLSRFGNRTLSVIAVNGAEKFTGREVSAAKAEMKSRLSVSVQSAFQSTGASSDLSAFSKKLIAQYSSMSVEERQAAGLDKAYYDALMKNYESSLKISQAFAGLSPTTSTQSLVDFI